MENSLTLQCPECSGRLVNDLSCFEQLGQVIAWEAFDPELGKVHFLTVASYNLQHPSQYTPEAMAGLKQNFEAYLDGRATIGQILSQTRAAYNGSRRVRKPEGQRTVEPRAWSKTISDVYVPNQPQGAASRVIQWAESIRREW